MLFVKEVFAKEGAFMGAFIEDFYQFKRKLEDMSIPELYEYVREKYPESEELAFGSKKIILRKVLNFERNRLNELE